jgi:hypothetical protein
MPSLILNKEASVTTEASFCSAYQSWLLACTPTIDDLYTY